MKALVLWLVLAGVARADEAPPKLIWTEREVSTPSARVWGTGVALFGASWLAAGIASSDRSAVGGIGFWPVLGAWIKAGQNQGGCGNGSCDRGTTALWALDGLVQAAGVAIFIVGLSVGPKKIERRRALSVSF